MADIILITILLAAVIAAVSYIVRAKKRGVKCIGCPDGCTGGCAGCTACSGNSCNRYLGSGK